MHKLAEEKLTCEETDLRRNFTTDGALLLEGTGVGYEDNEHRTSGDLLNPRSFGATNCIRYTLDENRRRRAKMSRQNKLNSGVSLSQPNLLGMLEDFPTDNTP